MIWVLPVCVVLAMALVLVRAALGPGLLDRVLALNTFGTLTVILLAFLATSGERYYVADIAILYALINFVLTLAILRFFWQKELREPSVGSFLSGLFYPPPPAKRTPDKDHPQS